jgi:hypothetical protein
LSGKPIKNCDQQSPAYGLSASNAQFARRGIRQELDVFDAAPELVEASNQQSSTVNCWFDTLWCAIKQPYAQSMFKIGNGSGNDRLRNSQAPCGLGHALPFHDGEQNVKVPQLDAAARSGFMQTSFERKMRAYLAAYASREHERRLGWNSFRVLVVATDELRIESMMSALAKQLGELLKAVALFAVGGWQR